MGVNISFLLSGCYCAGLLVISLLVRHLGLSPWTGVMVAGLLFLLVGGIAAVVVPRWWRTGPWASLWLLAGVVGLVAALNYGWRYPMPGVTDVSHILARGEAAGAQQEVWGWVQAMPRLTRNGNGQFWLQTNQIRSFSANHDPLGSPEPATGKLYVTVPAKEIDGVYPGQLVAVRGRLYEPSAPKNPNGFDFRQYLADNRSFAGFSGKWVNLEGPEPSRWGLWRLRQRIAKAQALGLGTPAGPLVSAMALGRKAVTDMPYEIQDAFVQAGLAHTLAASGFHVSLVLGVVLGIMSHPAVATRFANPALAKVIAGGTALIGYVFLTGGQPSVWRAALMGAGALVGLALERAVKPLGCLLLAVTLLLLWNPTWIDNVGFRLSVFATLGLMVSVKPLTDWLEWLPTTLATIVAVPVAAYFWTIPLSLYYFNTLTTYSILLNMLVTPLVMVLSLGGILTGLVAAFSPGIGAMLAWVLGLPAHLLIGLVNWQIALPGSSWATGHISLGQLLGLYSLYFLGWGHRWFRRRRWLVGLLLLLLAMGPLWYGSVARAEVTVLAAGNDAILVAQDRRSSLLINSGTDRTGFYTVVPFLRQAGINRLTHAVNWVDSDGANWQAVIAKTPIQNFWATVEPELSAIPVTHGHTLAPGQRQLLGNQALACLTPEATLCQLDLMNGHTWLMVAGLTEENEETVLKDQPHLHSEVLWWDGRALSEELIAAVGAEVAIASARSIDPDTRQRLLLHGTQVYGTEQDGAITWNPRQGYRAYLHQQHRQIASFE